MDVKQQKRSQNTAFRGGMRQYCLICPSLDTRFALPYSEQVSKSPFGGRI